MEFNDGKPAQSGMYLVDRGMQGKVYRYYNEKADFWGMCGFDMAEADENKDKTSAVGFFPWVGPLTGPNYNKKVEEFVEKPSKRKPAARKMAKLRMPGRYIAAASLSNQSGDAPVAKVKAPRVKSATVHPDGTVFYREDRQKWVAMYNGKQEAARPTAEACLKFLKKKYDVVGTVIEK
jgi:hypothetical protein